MKLIKLIQVKFSDSKRLQKKIYLSFGAIALVLAIIYWVYTSHYVSTDDGYINANVVQIATQVTGKVAQLSVVNNQYVTKGQLLFELDAEPFKVELERAIAAKALADSMLIHSRLTNSRIETLVRRRVLPVQSHDDAVADLESAEADVQLKKTDVDRARLNLDYTKIYAAANGWVTNMTLREGNVAEENNLLFSLVSSDEFWVDANFKETELERVRPGQRAEVRVDMYPDHVFRGEVESISGGSGAAFSLLPPQNATGNWVKVTQRIPVKVRILDVDSNHPLRIGTTANVRVYIK